MALDASGRLREDVSPGKRPSYLADENALVWCDVYSTQSGQHGPYGTLLREVFKFDELTVEDLAKSLLTASPASNRRKGASLSTARVPGPWGARRSALSFSNSDPDCVPTTVPP